LKRAYRIRLMTDASRYFSWLSLILIGLAILLPCLAAGVFTSMRQIPRAVQESPALPISPSLPGPVPVSIGLDWGVFRGGGGAAPAQGNLADRFRLAGTFFVRGGGGLNIRRAVLDWLERERQEIVSEGDRLDSVAVLRIGDDRVVLREAGQETTLWLSFSDHDGHDAETPESAGDPDRGDASVSNRFGRAVGKNNWLFQREALMQYRAELLDDPERLLNLFDSMEPLYNEAEKIEGYVLNLKGEEEFYTAVGFREGDVVRAVNAVPMTNRGRAESFIDQFAKSNLNVFVIDMERDGKPLRLTYRIR
jgi:type II secretory pathway component PulC